MPVSSFNNDIERLERLIRALPAEEADLRYAGALAIGLLMLPKSQN